MTLDEYQAAAGKTNKGTRLYVDRDPGGPAPDLEMVIGLYNALAMNGEAGELAEKIKKAARDGVNDLREHRHNAGLELGDVLWYVSQCARDFGYTLDEIANMNLEKLRSREARGVLSGSGDNR
jgi:NTP pyrophosphatase (non-canonical NTP hydrolase)